MDTAADTQPGTWITVGVLVGLALALLVGVLLAAASRARSARAARRPARHGAPRTSPATPAGPAAATAPVAPPARYELDDLPGFLESPPGSAPRPLPAAEPAAEPAPQAPAPATGSGAAGGATALGVDHRPADRGTTLGIAGAAVLLVAAVVVALVGGGAGSGDPTAQARAGTPPPPTPGPTSAPASTPAQPTPTGAPGEAPGSSAWTSVPLGRSGIAVSATFGGIVLEQRAVGLTVTYPSLSLTSDGSRSLAHLRLPTWNCFTAEPPADPTSAGCARSLVEYADLAGPALQVTRNGERLDVAGLFPTYLRPNGTAPAWTGRAYQLSVSTAPAGPVHDGQATATGVVRLGLASAPTVAGSGVNVLLLPR